MISQAEKNTILTLYKNGSTKTDIAKLIGRSRKTVIKYIKEDEDLNRELIEQEAGSVEQHRIMEMIAGKPRSKAQYKTRQRRKYTPEIEQEIKNILKDEDRKRETYGRDHKLQRTAKDIYNILKDKGFDISYSTVTMRLREMHRTQPEVFIRQHYPLGERAEFDFGERKITIAGERRKVYVAAICSSATNYRDFYVYPNQKSEVFMDAQIRFFKRVGVFREMVYDNMKNVVKRFVGRNERELTDTVLALSNYYGFKIVLTNTYSPNEKGPVEISVKWICHGLFANKDQFESWDELIDHVREVKKEMNKNIDLQEERRYLDTSKPAYELAEINERRVSKYSFIRDDGNDYSVPEAYAGLMVTVKRYLNTVEIFYRGELIASHRRLYGENESSVKLEHYLNTMLRKPGALVNSVALTQAPKLKELFNINYSDNPREFLELLLDNKDRLDTQELYELLSSGGHLKANQSNRSRIEEKSRQQLASVSTLFKGGARR